jgi:hypothetical protein
MVFVSALPSLVSGPLARAVMEPEAKFCAENWWTNILMISNYVNTEGMVIFRPSHNPKTNSVGN